MPRVTWRGAVKGVTWLMPAMEVMRPGRSDVPDRPTAGGAEELSGPSQIFFERKNVRVVFSI